MLKSAPSTRLANDFCSSNSKYRPWQLKLFQIPNVRPFPNDCNVERFDLTFIIHAYKFGTKPYEVTLVLR